MARTRATARRVEAHVSPTDRFTAAIKDLERLRDEFAGEIKDVRDRENLQLHDDLSTKIAEVDELKTEVADLEDQLLDQDANTDALCRVRRAIREGRKDDALWDLEKVLADLDSCWRTRSC